MVLSTEEMGYTAIDHVEVSKWAFSMLGNILIYEERMQSMYDLLREDRCKVWVSGEPHKRLLETGVPKFARKYVDDAQFPYQYIPQSEAQRWLLNVASTTQDWLTKLYKARTDVAIACQGYSNEEQVWIESDLLYYLRNSGKYRRYAVSENNRPWGESVKTAFQEKQ